MLTKKQLKQLRYEIVLNSLCMTDYENTLYIKSKTVCAFMGSYIDYLCGLADDDGYRNYDITDVFNHYDNINNLWNCYTLYASDPLQRDDYIAYSNDSIYSGCIIYDIEYGATDRVICASYYYNKFDEMIINRMTTNKIYYDSTNNAYFKKYGSKYYLKDFSRIRG